MIAVAVREVVAGFGLVLAILIPIFASAAAMTRPRAVPPRRCHPPAAPSSTAATYRTVLPMLLDHGAPDHDLTQARARTEWRRHRLCPHGECLMRAAAYRVLVDTGAITPARGSLL